MYAITGITGKVGGAVARDLLVEGSTVRAVLRDEAKAEEWKNRGCEVAFADMNDAAALTSAFAGTEGVFILPPSEFDPEPGFPEAKRVIEAITAALRQALPGKVVCLSTIGADALQENLLTQRTLLEHALSGIGIPVTFLRPGWFMENALWDVPAARDEGILRSFLAAGRQSIPHGRDPGCGACRGQDCSVKSGAERESFELEGPARVSPNDLAQAFATALERPVRVEIVRRESWEEIFRDQGTRNPTPRMRMLDGFNEGWISFRGPTERGTTALASVIAELTNTSHN